MKYLKFAVAPLLLLALAACGQPEAPQLSAQAVTFDAATGTGFVGKGDVQTALGYNNKQLNDNAGSLIFTYSATTVQETSWECVNQNNDKVQERERTTTTEVSGIVSHTERDNKRQITGFRLSGFGEMTSMSSTEGPKLNSCPNANSTYVLDSTVVGEPVVTGGGLFVNGVAL